MNPWESCALEYQFSDEITEDHDGGAANWRRPTQNADPVMYPGLYCPSGFDMMSILLRVATRPNPKVELGAIDCSVALLLCDLKQPDTPIVYASDAFIMLTGYSQAEIMGKNCRFLQAPGGKVKPKSSRKFVDDKAVRKMRHAVRDNTEVQMELTNFRKDGSSFTNLLTMIPVLWDSQDYRYSVGFQVEAEG